MSKQVTKWVCERYFVNETQTYFYRPVQVTVTETAKQYVFADRESCVGYSKTVSKKDGRLHDTREAAIMAEHKRVEDHIQECAEAMRELVSDANKLRALKEAA